MRNIIIVAAVLIGAGSLMGQMAARSTVSSSPPTTVAVASAPSQPKIQTSVPPGGRGQSAGLLFNPGRS